MYLTEAYLQEAFGDDEVAALCPTPAALARVIQQATAETETALQNGGYRSAVPSTVYTQLAPIDPALAAAGDCPASISLLAYGAWIEAAHGRKRVAIPDQFLEYVRKLDQVRSGKMELPGVSKDIGRAPGGVTASSSSALVTSGRPPKFSRKQFSDGGY